MDVRLKAVHLLASTGQPESFEQLRQLAVRDGVGEEVKTTLLEAMYKLDQQAKLKEQEELAVFEAAEVDRASREPQFETAALDSDAGEISSGFDFAFESASETEDQPEFGVEVQPGPDNFKDEV
jgi:hypothetical protein